MNLTEDYALRRTNVSRPRLSYTNSHSSIAASEDFYSLNGDDARSFNNRTPEPDQELLQPPQRFTTPPSRYHTPDDEREPLTAGPSVRLVPQTVAFNDSTLNRVLRRKPVGSPPTSPPAQSISAEQAEQKSLRSLKPGAGMEGERVSPTPGLDDTPYIRFAIDQLTRDEEVRGTRYYPSRNEATDAGVGPSTAASVGAAAGIASLPAAQHAIDEEEEREKEEYPVDRIVPDEGLGYMEAQRQRDAAELARLKELSAGQQPRHPLEIHSHQQQSSTTSFGREQYDVFVPYTPTVYTHQTPRLKFMPGILRPLWMAVFLSLCILMLAGLIFCAAWSSSNDGLWDYHKFGDNRYFVFEYLPMILGMIILLWLFQVQTAVQRISPFMAMASDSSKSRSKGAFLDLYPSQFLLPRLEYFRSGQPILGVCFLVFWLFLFQVPLLAAAFNIRYVGGSGSTSWRWVAVQGVIWVVIALYIELIIALVVLAVTLWSTSTGLKWDPRSLADIIALLERANIMNDYDGSESYSKIAEFKQRLWNRSDRLGYWHTSRRPHDIFYGLGEEGGPTRRYSLEQGRIREKRQPTHSTHSSLSSIGEVQAAGDYHIRSDIRSNGIRRRFVPWYLSDVTIVLWLLITLALLIAFLVVAFVNRATLGGFRPLLPAGSSSGGFSAANFLYSFIPCFIGMLLFLLYQPVDFANRRLAPFIAMSNSNGALAEKSLLLDYPYAMPGVVTLSAASNGDWKVAALSFVSLVNVAIPILSGGIFWAQWYPSAAQVRIAAQPSGIYALCFFLALYAFSFLLLFPGARNMRLPHGATCLAELISWLYMSPLLVDRAFVRCNSKAELVTRLVSKPPPGHDSDDPLRPKRSFWRSVTSLVHGKPGRPTAPLAQQTATNSAPAYHPTLPALPQPPVNPFDDQTRPPASPGSGYRLSAVPEGTAVPPRSSRRPPFNTAAAAITPPEAIRYGFGVYLGRDGKEHLGIERVTRGGRDMVIVEEHENRRGSWHRPRRVKEKEERREGRALMQERGVWWRSSGQEAV